MRRLSILVPLAVLLLASLGCSSLPQRQPAPPASAPAASPRPNLVVVLSDDQRWDALGAAGNPAVHTPVMDRLARDGVYFRQATISVSQCHPVRASLLTGLPAFRHGVYRGRDAGYPAPPAQIPACASNALGSCLGS